MSTRNSGTILSATKSLTRTFSRRRVGGSSPAIGPDCSIVTTGGLCRGEHTAEIGGDRLAERAFERRLQTRKRWRARVECLAVVPYCCIELGSLRDERFIVGRKARNAIVHW